MQEKQKRNRAKVGAVMFRGDIKCRGSRNTLRAEERESLGWAGLAAWRGSHGLEGCYAIPKSPSKPKLPAVTA